MFLLNRKISAYTHHDIIIGIFQNIVDAQKAKHLYIQKCKKEDKWAEQAYSDVNLDDDITIKNVLELIQIDHLKSTYEFHVVSLFSEGFGQITRSIESIFTTESEAKTYLKQKESEEPEYEPSWYEIETITLSKIYFDK